MAKQNYALQISQEGVRLLGLKNKKEVNAIAFLKDDKIFKNNNALIPETDRMLGHLEELKKNFSIRDNPVSIAFDNRYSIKGQACFNDDLGSDERRFLFHWLSNYYITSSISDYKNYVECRKKLGSYHYQLYYIREKLLSDYLKLINEANINVSFIGFSQQVMINVLENVFPKLLKNNAIVLYHSGFHWEMVAWYNRKIDFSATLYDFKDGVSHEMNQQLLQRNLNIKLFDYCFIMGETADNPPLKKEIEKILQIETKLINLFNQFKVKSNIKRKVGFQALQSFTYCLGLASVKNND